MNPSSIRVSDHLAFLMLALQDDLDEGTVVGVVSHAILSIKFRLLSINRPRLTVKVNGTLISSRARFGIPICDVEDYLWAAANTNSWSHLTTELFSSQSVRILSHHWEVSFCRSRRSAEHLHCAPKLRPLGVAVRAWRRAAG